MFNAQFRLLLKQPDKPKGKDNSTEPFVISFHFLLTVGVGV